MSATEPVWGEYWVERGHQPPEQGTVAQRLAWALAGDDPRRVVRVTVTGKQRPQYARERKVAYAPCVNRYGSLGREKAMTLVMFLDLFDRLGSVPL